MCRTRSSHAPVGDHQTVAVSSQRIRQLVEAGDLAGAARLLGRPFEVEGVVVEGDRRGRLLGFPTANLRLAPEVVLPPNGIYAGAARGHRAAVSIGVNPHYGGAERRFEAYLLDFDGDLYGERVSLDFVAHLREQRVYEGIEPLVAQIREDVEETRALLR